MTKPLEIFSFVRERRRVTLLLRSRRFDRCSAPHLYIMDAPFINDALASPHKEKVVHRHESISDEVERRRAHRAY